ncbi:MAG: DUF1559 domain-containing protein [Candidatus Brocadiae bacterium]|nr:DUF1559 domain-containing protein [Candidatus Brocadiia bacterium]
MWRRLRRERGESKAPWVVIIIAAVGCGGLLLISVVGILAGMMLPALARAREEARRIRCRNNLNQVAKGMATYLNEFGDNRFYTFPMGRGTQPDDFNGAEWLASLYWTGTVPDPGVFICPSSPDTNDNGDHLGTHKTTADFGSQTVSYAGMHYRSLDVLGVPRAMRAIRDDFPPNEPMGCDDTQGSINHGQRNNGGMSVLFFDSHVEFRTNIEIDLEQGVGDPRTLLRLLRN